MVPSPFVLYTELYCWYLRHSSCTQSCAVGTSAIRLVHRAELLVAAPFVLYTELFVFYTELYCWDLHHSSCTQSCTVGTCTIRLVHRAIRLLHRAIRLVHRAVLLVLPPFVLYTELYCWYLHHSFCAQSCGILHHKSIQFLQRIVRGFIREMYIYVNFYLWLCFICFSQHIV